LRLEGNSSIKKGEAPQCENVYPCEEKGDTGRGERSDEHGKGGYERASGEKKLVTTVLGESKGLRGEAWGGGEDCKR